MKYIIFTDVKKDEVTNSLEELSKNHNIIGTQFTTNQTQTSSGYVSYTTFSVLVEYKIKD